MIYKTLHRMTDNTMANGSKDNQWSTKHYTEWQTIQWPKEVKTTSDLQNTTQNDRQYNGQRKYRQPMIYKTLHRMTDNTMAKGSKDNQWSTKYCT
jgi:hypothetical protein